MPSIVRSSRNRLPGPQSRGQPVQRMRLLERMRLVSLWLGAWVEVLEGLTDQLERLVKVFERLVRVMGHCARLGTAVIAVVGIVAMFLLGVI